jgi:hypothetical protein
VRDADETAAGASIARRSRRESRVAQDGVATGDAAPGDVAAGDVGVLGVAPVGVAVTVGSGVGVSVGVGVPQPSQNSRLSPPQPPSIVAATTSIAAPHMRIRMAAGYRNATRNVKRMRGRGDQFGPGDVAASAEISREEPARSARPPCERAQRACDATSARHAAAR